MDNTRQLEAQIREALSQVKGLQGVCPLYAEDRQKILSLEEEAEKRSLMGMGKVLNSGVREVLQFDSVYVALTNLEFKWGHCASLILKKGDQRVGEEVYDETVIAELSKDPNAWFMHKNFVIYKDRVSFPQDIMQKICHFELPGLPADWFSLGSDDGIRSEARYAHPSTLGDVHLKKHHFDGTDHQGLGTILFGVNIIANVVKETVK